MKTKGIILGALATLVMFSCSGNKATASEQLQTNKAVANEQLQTDSVVYNHSDKRMEVRIVFDYPTAGNQYLKNSIAEYISEQLGATYMGPLDNKESLLQHYVASTKKYLNANIEELGLDADQMVSWSADIRKDCETDKYVTYTCGIYQYLGGAHGIGNMSGMTFRKSDGRRFGSEILKQSVYGDRSFNTILKEGMKDYFQEFDGKRMTDQELQESIVGTDCTVDFLPLPKTAPYLTKEGVMIIYQPYELFSYAAGCVRFVVPFSKIKPYLNAEVIKML